MSLIEEQCYLPQCTMTRAAAAAASVGSAEQPTLLLTPVRSASSPPSHVLQTTTMSRSSYSAKMQMFTRKNQCKWIIFLAVAILTLVFLIVGAVALVMMSENRHIPTRTDHDNTGNALSAALSHQQTEEAGIQKGAELIFEYVGEQKKKEQVIIDLKKNSTELFSEQVDVLNHFTKRMTIHRVEVSPGVQVCLIKTITAEVNPDELADALSQSINIQVNSTEVYLIDTAPLPQEILNDMTVIAFCPSLEVYTIKKVDEHDTTTTGIPMEQLIASHQERGRQRRESAFQPSNPLDIHHDSETYYCGGPIGEEPKPAMPYKCTKTQSFCFKNLVNERCEECYHGHFLRTRGCWCPITAIHTCIKISWRPVNRLCCGVNQPPCIRSECDEHWRVPYVPIPVITFSITPNDD